MEFDVFDANGRLLLRRGNAIGSEAQLRRLIDEGIFFAEAPPDSMPEPANLPIEHEERQPRTELAPSVFALLKKCRERLKHWSQAPPDRVAGSFFGTIEALTHRIR